MSSNREPNPSFTTPPTAACITNQRRISDYLSHTLDQADAAALQQHLATCPYCRSNLALYSSLDQHIASLPNPPASPRVRNAVLQVVAAVEQEQNRLQPVPTRVSRIPRLAGSVAALGLLVAFAGALGLLLGGRGNDSVPVAFASPTISIPASVTPVLDTEPAAKGTVVADGLPSRTPVPDALLARSVQASGTDTTTALIFTSVDSTGMTQTVATRPDLLPHSPVTLSPDQSRAAYTVQRGGDTRLEVYDFAGGQVAASLVISDPRIAKGYDNYSPNMVISPDNKQLAYGAYYGQFWNWDGAIFDLSSGSRLTPPPPDRQLLPSIGVTAPFYLGWGADSILYSYSFTEGSTVYVGGSSVDGKHEKSIPDPTNYRLASSPWLDQSGKSIYFLIVDADKGAPLEQSSRQIMRYDVIRDKFISVVSTDSGFYQARFAETTDGNQLLYIQTDAPAQGSGLANNRPAHLEINRVDLRSGYSSKLADVPSVGTRDASITAMQACGTTLYYQVASTDAAGHSQTQLIAQPLDGGAAHLLTAQGQLLGCR